MQSPFWSPNKDKNQRCVFVSGQSKQNKTNNIALSLLYIISYVPDFGMKWNIVVSGVEALEIEEKKMVKPGSFLKCKKQINRTSKRSAFIMSEKAWPVESGSQGFKSYFSLLDLPLLTLSLLSQPLEICTSVSQVCCEDEMGICMWSPQWDVNLLWLLAKFSFSDSFSLECSQSPSQIC